MPNTVSARESVTTSIGRRRTQRRVRTGVVAACLFGFSISLFSCVAAKPVEFSGLILPATVLPSGTVRVLAFGDQGDGSAAQIQTAAAMVTRQSVAPYDFALVLGDNFYEVGVYGVDDPQFDTKFRNVYPAADLPFRFYVVPGNHDYFGDADAEYEYVDPDGRWTAPGIACVLPVELSDGYRVDFFLVDSEVLVRRDAYADAVAAWVRESIRESSADLRVFACHRPFYSSGTHGDTSELLFYFSRELADGRIDVAVAGHDHDLELQRRDANGDGRDELFLISGAAARTRSISPGPYTTYSAGITGFVTLEISAATVSVAFYDSFAFRLDL
ncbi:MAG TPA: metallophosphoesterase [Spirochaetia bacterium]|nr:metallophosphoesterase [Spirochaetia bacterium]